MTAHREHGLTLVELVITISLAAILSIPVSLLLSGQLNGALRARDATVAMNLARYEMERLDSLNNFCDASLTVNSPAGTTTDPYLPGYPYALTRIVSCLVGGSNCTSACAASPAAADNAVKRIDIIVRRSGSTSPLASLVSYRTKYVQFGP